MSDEFSVTARRLGIVSAMSIVVLDVAYAITLALGFLTLKSPDQPIGDPMFTILEVLIIIITPTMVALMVVRIHPSLRPGSQLIRPELAAPITVLAVLPDSLDNLQQPVNPACLRLVER